ncbi:MAG TPA: hypothetical protein VIZ90_08835, partial [Rhizobiaceae bacterium]
MFLDACVLFVGVLSRKAARRSIVPRLVAALVLLAVGSQAAEANANDPGLKEGPVPKIELANGNLLEELIPLL